MSVARTKNSDGSITIEGRPVPMEDGDRPIVDLSKEACPLCSLGLPIHYTDVLIISQFLRKDGQLLPRLETGVCAKQQRHLAILTHKAQNAGLLRPLQPPLPDGRIRKDPKQSKYKFRGLNRYFTDAY